MVLDTEQTKMLLNGADFYDCSLVKQKFAYEFFQQNLQPLGNALLFAYPTTIGSLVLDEAINICIEMPNYDIISGICFERLLLAQIGSFLSEYLKKDCFVNENTLLIEEKQACVTIMNTIKNSLLLHIILPNLGEHSEFYFLNFSKEDVSKLSENVLKSFHFLTKSIFIESQHNSL